MSEPSERTTVRIVLDKQLHVSTAVNGGYPSFTIETGTTTIELVTEAEEQGRAMDREDLRTVHTITDTLGGFTHSIVRAISSPHI